MNLINDNCLKAMTTIADNSIDTVVTDPPYGLNFMGKEWDRLGDKSANYTNLDKPHSSQSNFPMKKSRGRPIRETDGKKQQEWHLLWAKEALRVAKPGAFLLCFGGTRTYHRIACAIEDAGWEIRDCIMWVYGSGFPKSLNIQKQLMKTAKFKTGIDFIGYGTALKPAYEPIIVAMKSADGSFANNALKHGVAGLNIDDCRIPINQQVDDKRLGGNGEGKTDKTAKNVYEGGYAGDNIKSSESGRFPANLIHDGSQEVMDLFPNTKTGKVTSHSNKGIWGSEKDTSYNHLEVSGSAGRFFYCAKASRSERDKGLENCEEKAKCDIDKMGGAKCTMKTGSGNDRNVKYKNHHPTVKPLKLMEYLCKLTRTPSGGVVLDPFMGSGTTGIACINTGRDFIGIEKESEYFEIAQRRINDLQNNRSK